MSQPAIIIDLIKIRRSHTPGYRPPLDVNDNKRLTDGELFINVPDGLILVGSKNGPPVEFRSAVTSQLPSPQDLPSTSGAEAGAPARWHLNGAFLCYG